MANVIPLRCSNDRKHTIQLSFLKWNIHLKANQKKINSPWTGGINGYCNVIGYQVNVQKSFLSHIPAVKFKIKEIILLIVVHTKAVTFDK